MISLLLRLVPTALVGWRALATATALYTSTLWSDDALCVLINVSLVVWPFLLLLAITGLWMSSLAGASSFAIFIFAMGEIKANYFGTRLVLGDWAFIAEPVNWTIVGHYPRIYGALALFGLGLALLAVDAVRWDRQRLPLGPRLRALTGVLAIVLAGWLWSERHHHAWEVWNDDANCGEMYRCGALSRLLFSVAMFEYQMPAHEGDPAPFLAKAAQLPPLETPQTKGAPCALLSAVHGETEAAALNPGPAIHGRSTVDAGEQCSPRSASPLPDIVLWLNESTFDPRGFKLPGAKLPAMPMFDADKFTKTRGPMRVHTFGGKTWLSEFSVLTGLVPDDFGVLHNVVLSSVGPKTHSNLFRLLKANGYHTVVLMPTYKRFYGAGHAYEGMGVDEVLTLRDFHEYDALPGDEWDIAETDRLAEATITRIKRQRAESPGQPIFVYLLSIREHAPYSGLTRIDYNLDHAGVPKFLSTRLTDYVNRLRRLDKAVAMIDRYLFAAGAPPALYAWFGDHQAYYEGESPPYSYRLQKPDYVTQFQIRANYDAAAAPAVPILDIAYVPSLIADLGGLKRDAYFEGLSAMRRLCNGGYEDCKDQPLLDSYKARVFGPELNQFDKE